MLYTCCDCYFWCIFHGFNACKVSSSSLTYHSHTFTFASGPKGVSGGVDEKGFFTIERHIKCSMPFNGLHDQWIIDQNDSKWPMVTGLFTWICPDICSHSPLPMALFAEIQAAESRTLALLRLHRKFSTVFGRNLSGAAQKSTTV